MTFAPHLPRPGSRSPRRATSPPATRRNGRRQHSADIAADVGVDADARADADAETTDVRRTAPPGDPCGVAITPAVFPVCFAFSPRRTAAPTIGACAAVPDDCTGSPWRRCATATAALRNECEACRAGAGTLPHRATWNARRRRLRRRHMPAHPRRAGRTAGCVYLRRRPRRGPAPIPKRISARAPPCDPGCDCFLVLECLPGFLMPHNGASAARARPTRTARPCCRRRCASLPVPGSRDQPLRGGRCRTDADCTAEAGTVRRRPGSLLGARPAADLSKFCHRATARPTPTVRRPGASRAGEAL